MITNQIIQYWHTTAIPPRIVRLMNTWKDFNGEFVHKVYHRAEARQYLQKVFGNAAVYAFDDCAFPAMEADLFRYAVLAKEGGIYVDADEECLRSLVEIINLNCQLVGYRRPNGFIANSFIAVIPESAIMRETFETSVANVLNKSSQNLFLVTGPPVLTAVLKRYLPLSDVTILTCEEYYSLAKIHGPGLLPYKRQQHWSKLQKKFSIFKSLQE